MANSLREAEKLEAKARKLTSPALLSFRWQRCLRSEMFLFAPCLQHNNDLNNTSLLGKTSLMPQSCAVTGKRQHRYSRRQLASSRQVILQSRSPSLPTLTLALLQNAKAFDRAQIAYEKASTGQE